jgi:hypothetical protein
MLPVLRLLADDDDPFGIIIACFLLLVIVVGGGYLAMWLRKRYWGTEEGEPPPMGFTLGDLRALHKAGRLSVEEFEKAKEKIVTAAKRAAERDAKSAKPPSGNQHIDGQ